jgi:hypothetical protein
VSEFITFGIYVAGVVLAYYPIVHTLAHYMGGEDPDGWHWACSLWLGAIGAVLWPVALAVVAVFLVSKRIWTGTWTLPWRTPMRDHSKVR